MQLIEREELDEIREVLDYMRKLIYACKPVCDRLIEKLDKTEEQLNVWEFRLKYSGEEDEYENGVFTE